MPLPPSPEQQRIAELEAQTMRQWQWIGSMHHEILRLRSRVSNLEKLRRIALMIATKAWALFWNEPMKYLMMVVGLYLWLTGKLPFGQAMQFGANGVGEH